MTNRSAGLVEAADLTHQDIGKVAAFWHKTDEKMLDGNIDYIVAGRITEIRHHRGNRTTLYLKGHLEGASTLPASYQVRTWDTIVFPANGQDLPELVKLAAEHPRPETPK